eukprot:2646807-Pyramimonas_sp.AAC.1
MSPQQGHGSGEAWRPWWKSGDYTYTGEWGSPGGAGGSKRNKKKGGGGPGGPTLKCCHCGCNKNDVKARFCKHCGAGLQQVRVQDPPPASGAWASFPPPGVFALPGQVPGGDGAGKAGGKGAPLP